jgi:hypothetical protein
MKEEHFFIGPYDEDISVDFNLSLSELKHLHSILVDCYNSQLRKGSADRKLENFVIFFNEMITKSLVMAEKGK